MSSRILVLAPFAPRFDAPHGGRVTASLVSRLAERQPVALVCFRDVGEPPTDDGLRERCDLVEEVVVQRPSPGVWRRRARQLAKPLWGYPSVVARAAAPGFVEQARSVAERWRPDVVQIELMETARHLSGLDDCPAPRIVVDHDPGASGAEDWAASSSSGLLRSWRRSDAAAWRRFATRVLEQVDAVVALTDEDAAKVRSVAPKGVRIIVIPRSVEVPEHPLDPSGDGSSKVLFFGGYDHPPNLDAALWLERSIFPEVRRRHPAATLQLVGKGPRGEMYEAAGDGVDVVGPVESLTPYLDRAAVVAAPLRLGGGMRVKVLETLAAGKALVASPRALAGLTAIDGENVIVAETDDEFVEAVSRLLRNEEQRVALGASARRWVEAEFGWEQIVAAYEALYAELLAGRE